LYYFRLLFYYNYRHGSIFDYYMADAVFKQAFNSAETARANDNGIAFFLAALLDNFRRRAAADNQHIRAGNVLLIDYMLSSAQNFVAYLHGWPVYITGQFAFQRQLRRMLQALAGNG
jgi:hypothetical protein